MTIPVKLKEIEIGEGMPKICVPLTAVHLEKLCEEAERAKSANPDLIEWRADFYEHLFDKSELLKALTKIRGIIGQIPLIFTIRTKEEGGNVTVSLKDYTELNLTAASSECADLVDVEIFSGNAEENVSGKKMILVAEKLDLISKIHGTAAKVIASSHDFSKTACREELLKRFRLMNDSGADILKMAVMPHCADDVEAIMEMTDKMRKEYTDRPLVSMSMGEIGKKSRIEGETFGSSVTFAAVGAASAPGQISIDILRKKMNIHHQKYISGK